MKNDVMTTTVLNTGSHQTKRTVDVVSPSATTAATSLPTPPNCLLRPPLTERRQMASASNQDTNRQVRPNTHNTLHTHTHTREREAILHVSVYCSLYSSPPPFRLIDRVRERTGSTTPPSFFFFSGDGGADVVDA